MNIAQWLYQSSARFADSPALFRGTTEVADYATFAGRAAAIADILRDQHGIGKGDRVGLFPTVQVYIILFLCVAAPVMWYQLLAALKKTKC